jgi:hypothetical protein
MLRTFARSAALVLVFGALPAAAYPGGTPNYQTDAAPFCASCHSSRTADELAGLGEFATKSLAENKHYAVIRAGKEGYASLSAAERATLIEQLQALDRASTVTLEAPAKVAPGAIFEVTVSVTGGAGPAVGIGLVDAPHRNYARPAPSAGFLVEAPPVITGPDGQLQTGWLDKRPESLGRNLSFVNVTGIASDASKAEWSKASVTWKLRAPTKPGSHPLVASYWYGTEKGSPLGYTTDPVMGKQVRGGFTGASGRVLFSDVHSIVVQ